MSGQDTSSSATRPSERSRAALSANSVALAPVTPLGEVPPIATSRGESPTSPPLAPPSAQQEEREEAHVIGDETQW